MDMTDDQLTHSDDGTPVPETPPTAAPPTADVDPNNPPWLGKRLAEEQERTQRKLMRDLGVDNLDQLKAALQMLKDVEDEKKTELQRLADQLAELKPAAERLSSVETVLDDLLEREIEAIPDAQREHVDALLAVIPTPEGKFAALRNWQASFRAMTQVTPKPAPPNDNAAEGSRQSNVSGISADEMATLREYGLSDEEIAKYRS